MSRVTVVLWLVLATLAPAPVSAQRLSGRVVTGTPDRGVPGVVLILRDSTGHEVARVLSSPSGAFELHAPFTGDFHITTLRIGFRRGDFGPFHSAEQSSHAIVLSLSDIPTTLPSVRVSEQTDCHSREEGGDAMLTVWDEAQKALLATVLTRTDRRPIVTAATFERDIADPDQRLLHQQVTHRTGVSTRPFISPLSPDDYAIRGYEEHDSTSTTFRAPDADVLLSDSFAAGHCFRLVGSESDASLIGLAFRPTRRDNRVDVAGTLWLDRASAQLRLLDFSFSGLPQLPAGTTAGGSMSFVRMSNGAWMITHWQLHVPKVSVSQVSSAGPAGTLARTGSVVRTAVSKSTVTDTWEFGGDLLAVWMEGERIWTGRGGRVDGTVKERATERPIAGARVTLLESDYRTTSDSAGHFEMQDVLHGSYHIAVSHETASRLSPEETAVADIEVSANAVATVHLHTPSVREVLLRACTLAHAEVKEHEGVLQGTVRDADGHAVGGDSVFARWVTLDTRGSEVVGPDIKAMHNTTIAGTDGAFRFCGIPFDRPITVFTRRGPLQSTPQVVKASESDIVREFDIPAVTNSRP